MAFMYYGWRSQECFQSVQPEKLQGNAESNIAVSHGCIKVRLVQLAIRRVRTPLNGKEAVHSAVTASIDIELESCFAECAAGFFKRRRNGIGAAQAWAITFAGFTAGELPPMAGCEWHDKALISVEDWGTCRLS